MRWLLHGNLTNAAVEALKRHGHDTRRAQEAGLPADAAPADVIEAARKGQLDILTADPAFAHAPFEQSLRFGRTIVWLNVSPADVEQDDAVDRLFARYKRLSPGRLYTVTTSRVKIRQLPGQRSNDPRAGQAISNED